MNVPNAKRRIEAEAIHFGSTDPRDCGSHEQGRRWTTEQNDVTCAGCKARDTVKLTPQGEAYVASLALRAALAEAAALIERAAALLGDRYTLTDEIRAFLARVEKAV